MVVLVRVNGTRVVTRVSYSLIFFRISGLSVLVCFARFHDVQFRDPIQVGGTVSARVSI